MGHLMPKTTRMLTIICLVLLISLMLTGCFDVRIHLKVNLNGSGEVEVFMKANRNVMFFGDPFEEIMSDLELDGFTIEDYAEGNEVGFLAQKKASSLDELTHLKLGEDMVISDKEMVTVDEGLFKNTFIVDAELDLNEILGEDMAGMARLADIRFALTLPIRPSDHNATAVSEDGKTLEWKLLPGSSNDIQVAASAPNINIVFLLLAVVGAGAVLLIVFRLRRSSANRDQKIKGKNVGNSKKTE